MTPNRICNLLREKRVKDKFVVTEKRTQIVDILSSMDGRGSEDWPKSEKELVNLFGDAKIFLNSN